MTDLWPSLHRAKPKSDDEPILSFESPSQQGCPTCDDESTVETFGNETICTRCGTIVDVPLELGAEYRWFSADSGNGQDPSRCGFPINHLMPESSLGTMIMASTSSPLMRRIKRYHMWNLMPYRERTLWTIFESLQVRATNAGIGTAVLEEAKELFAQLTASAICRGQAQRDSMLAACLWEALKRHGTPRMPKDIAEIFNIPLKQVTKGNKQFQHLFAIRTSGQLTNTYANASSLEADVPAKPVEESAETIAARAFQRRAIWQKTASRTTSYEDFIKPFMTNLSVPRASATQMEKLVYHVCAKTEELGIVPENTPPSLTASVIAFCSQQMNVRIDITEIARVCGISAVTIQKCLKRMGPWKEKLLEQ
jgi:transcription initiation factor TFIIB